MRNFVTISAFIFLNLWSYGQCGYLDEFYGDPRIYIQTQNYTVNLFPIIIPLAAFTLGKIKFIYSKKASKFCEIFTLLLSYVVPVKNEVEISKKFVAFSEL